MTLTELRYIVALARERHFGRAAEKCFVSQPTLSVAIKKLEEELGITLFERHTSDVSVTPLGARIVEQAQRVLEETAAIRHIAAQGKDQLASALRVGAIYTVGPYLLPQLIPIMHKRAPNMPLLLQENYTGKLGELLRSGELDVAILSLPFADTGIVTRAVYDEPFRVVMPANHAWSRKVKIPAAELCNETLLLLGAGNCFRDQVLQTCPRMGGSGASNLQQALEGSSLETIRHMVASGIGLTVLPRASVPDMKDKNGMLSFVPFSAPVPSRRVVIVWRKSFTRRAAIDAICDAVAQCDLPGVEMVAPEAAAA